MPSACAPQAASPVIAQEVQVEHADSHVSFDFGHLAVSERSKLKTALDGLEIPLDAFLRAIQANKFLVAMGERRIGDDHHEAIFGAPL